MDIAASGVGPLTGFMGESLAGTPREHLMGQDLANGWRNVDVSKNLFGEIVNPRVSSFTNCRSKQKVYV